MSDDAVLTRDEMRRKLGIGGTAIPLPASPTATPAVAEIPPDATPRTMNREQMAGWLKSRRIRAAMPERGPLDAAWRGAQALVGGAIETQGKILGTLGKQFTTDPVAERQSGQNIESLAKDPAAMAAGLQRYAAARQAEARRREAGPPVAEDPLAPRDSFLDRSAPGLSQYSVLNDGDDRAPDVAMSNMLQFPSRAQRIFAEQEPWVQNVILRRIGGTPARAPTMQERAVGSLRQTAMPVVAALAPEVVLPLAVQGAASEARDEYQGEMQAQGLPLPAASQALNAAATPLEAATEAPGRAVQAVEEATGSPLAGLAAEALIWGAMGKTRVPGTGARAAAPGTRGGPAVELIPPGRQPLARAAPQPTVIEGQRPVAGALPGPRALPGPPRALEGPAAPPVAASRPVPPPVPVRRATAPVGPPAEAAPPPMPPARPAPPEMPPARPVPDRIPGAPVPRRVPGRPKPVEVAAPADAPAVPMRRKTAPRPATAAEAAAPPEAALQPAPVPPRMRGKAAEPAPEPAAELAVPEARATGGIEKFATVPTESLGYRPEVFQFKKSSHTLRGKRFRQEHAEPIDVWIDRKGEIGEPGKSYVVDGQSRWNRAVETDTPTVDVRYIEAPNAREAKLFGARKNLAADTVKVSDAASFFRTLGLKGEPLDAYLREWDIPTAGRRVEQGKYVAELPEKLWDRYLGLTEGKKVSENQAVELGRAKAEQGLTDAQVEALADLVQSRRLPVESIDGLARRAKLAAEGTKTEQSLFGEDKVQQSHLIEEERLERGLRKRFGEQRRLKDMVARRAAELEAVGNKIEAEATRESAAHLGQVLEVFDRLAHRAGPINDAIKDAARRKVAGEPLKSVTSRLDADVFEAVRKELGTRAFEPPPAAKPVEPPAAEAVPEGLSLFGEPVEAAPAPAPAAPEAPAKPPRRKTAPKPKKAVAEEPPAPPTDAAPPEATPPVEPPPTTRRKTKPQKGATPKMGRRGRKGERGSALVPIPEEAPRRAIDMIRKELVRSVKWLGEEFGEPGRDLSDRAINTLVLSRKNIGTAHVKMEEALAKIPPRMRNDVDARLYKMVEGREKPRTPAEENLVEAARTVFKLIREVSTESGVRITDAPLRRRIFRKMKAQMRAYMKGDKPKDADTLSKFEEAQVAEWETRFGKGATEEAVFASPQKLRALSAEYDKLAKEAREKDTTPERRTEINVRREEIHDESRAIRQRYREMEQRTIHGEWDEYFPMKMSKEARELVRKRDPETMRKLYEFNSKEFDSVADMERELAKAEKGPKKLEQSRARSFFAGTELPRRFRLPDEMREPSSLRAIEATLWSAMHDAAEHKVFKYRDPKTWLPRGERGEGDLGHLLQKISESHGRGDAENARMIFERIMHRRAQDLAESNERLRNLIAAEGFITAARLFSFNAKLFVQQSTQARNVENLVGAEPFVRGLTSATMNYGIARALAYSEGSILGSTMYQRSGIDNSPRSRAGRTAEAIIEIASKPISMHDEFWRVVATEATPHYADALIKKLHAGSSKGDKASAIHDLTELDFSPAEIGQFKAALDWDSLDPFLQTKLRQRVTSHANVEATPADRPRLLTSPQTKPIARLKTFSFRDAAFAVKFPIQEALAGRPKRLIKYLLWTVGQGEVLNAIYEAIWGPRDRPTMTEIAEAEDEAEAAALLAERLADDLMVGSFLGIIGSTALDMVSGDAEKSTQRFFTPPSVDTIADTGRLMDDQTEAVIDEIKDPDGSFWGATAKVWLRFLGRQVVFPGQIERAVEANTEAGQRERVRNLSKVRGGVSVPRKGKERLRQQWMERLKDD